MAREWLLERMASWKDRPALIWRDRPFSFGRLLDLVAAWQSRLDAQDVRPGQVVMLESDFSPNSIALFLSLISRKAIAVPTMNLVEAQRKEYQRIGEAKWNVVFDDADEGIFQSCESVSANELVRSLRDQSEPGLILFSSGSTGKPKASLHNLTRLLEKFETPREALRTVALPPMDHIAGLDTLFYTLSSGGTLIRPSVRTPDLVCESIQAHRAELLPASATFLSLLLISEAHRRFDLSSLRIIAYGSDVMPAATLTRLKEVLPHCKYLQKYGTTEIGSPITRSKGADGSLWMKIDGEGIETKIVDGTLWIRSRSAMLGYLNAPSPFDADGWMNTEDVVEVEGDYFRILGRKSEIINVGGQKVYPAEIEGVLLQMGNVRDVTVYGEKNPIMGNVVAARVNLIAAEELSDFKRRMRAFCKERLASYKIPVKIEIGNREQFSARFKKRRLADPSSDSE